MYERLVYQSYHDLLLASGAHGSTVVTSISTGPIPKNNAIDMEALGIFPLWPWPPFCATSPGGVACITGS